MQAQFKYYILVFSLLPRNRCLEDTQAPPTLPNKGLFITLYGVSSWICTNLGFSNDAYSQWLVECMQHDSHSGGFPFRYFLSACWKWGAGANNFLNARSCSNMRINLLVQFYYFKKPAVSNSNHNQLWWLSPIPLTPPDVTQSAAAVLVVP